MLVLRIAWKLWREARDPELLAADLQGYLNTVPQWVWNQRARYRDVDGVWRVGAERPVMASMERDAILKLVLRPAAEGADYLLVALRRIRDVERYEAVNGRSLKGETFRVLRAWESESVLDVVVVIRPTYLQLPQFLKAPIIFAWNRLVAGREQAKVAMGQDTLFVIRAVSDHKLITELDNALADAGGVGRTSTDSFEARRAVELIEKYGEKCGRN